MQISQSSQSIFPSTKPYTLQLTQDQYQFIQRNLPQYISIHQIKRSGKKQKKQLDSKLSQKELSLGAPSRSSRYLDINKDVEIQQMLPKRNRSKKIDDYSIDESPKRKPKGNFYKTGGYSGRLTEEELSVCNSIITQLKRNPNSKPFLTPVNPVELKIPDYFDIINNPMDISTIESKLKYESYTTTRQFKDDLVLIWMNSYKYNQKGSDIYYMTSEMDKLTSKLLEKLPTPTTPSYSSTLLSSHYSQTPKKPHNPYYYPHKQKKPKPVVHKEAQPSSARLMTIYQKRKLCDDIKNLSKDQLSGVWKILAQDNDYPDMVFDVEKLSPEKLWELDAYIKVQKGVEQEVEQIYAEKARSEESSSFLLESESEK